MKAPFRKIDILAATVLTGLVSTAVLGQVSVGEPSLLKKVCPAIIDKMIDGKPYSWDAYMGEPDAICTYDTIRDSETDEVIGAYGTCSVIV